jgi:hypothetical protein
MPQKTVRLYVLSAYVDELAELLAAARKQPGDPVTLDFAKVRELADRIKAYVS